MSIISSERASGEPDAAFHGYDDFSASTAIRKDQLVVEGRTLYVNLGYLAEYSKFFAECFEKKMSPIFIDEFNYNEVIELLRVCFFTPRRKPVNHLNINTVVTMASQFGMEPLMKRCEHVIATQADLFTSHRLFELTKTLSKHQRNGPSMKVMIDRLARMDIQQFEALPFKSIPGDVVADLYSLKLQEAQKQAHRKEVWPRLKSLVTCAWLSSCLCRNKPKEVRGASRQHARPRTQDDLLEETLAMKGKKRQPKMFTSTPIVPPNFARGGGGGRKVPAFARYGHHGADDSEGAMGSDLEIDSEEDKEGGVFVGNA